MAEGPTAGAIAHWARVAGFLVGLSVLAACTGPAPPRPPSTDRGRSPDNRMTSRQDEAHSIIKRPLADTPQPNVLIFLTDDQRADQTLRVMPNTLKWFWRQGVQFRHAFATTPLCCPSRASILTGRYAHNHGVHTNYDPSPLDSRTTLPRYLQLAGYSTAIVGKFLNSWGATRSPPYFDRWAIEDAYQYYNVTFNVRGELTRVLGYSTTYIRGKTVEFLRGFERRDRQPWFLLVAPLAAHEPFTPELRYDSAAVPTRRDNPSILEAHRSDKPLFVRRQKASPRWTYELPRRQLRTLKSVDDLIGKVMTSLTRLDEESNTLAFFLSDNGYLWGEHGITEKRLPYTPAIRIPLFVRWPGFVASGVVDERLVANIDLAPTILEAAHAVRRQPRSLDGRSLFSPHSRSRLLLEYWRDPALDFPDWASVRARWSQYVEYYGRGGSVLFREYYDLAKDPWQLKNLLGDSLRANDPDVRRWSRQLDRLQACVGRECP